MSLDSRPALLALCLLCSPADEAGAEGASFAVQSDREKVAVLELYTSEGCNSCPPADEFVSTLARSDYYPRNVIPLAFHVTYWDGIGWRDPYAKSLFDDRQYAVAARDRSDQVYTPQLLLDGRSLRGTGGFLDRLEALNALAPDADIAVRGNLAEDDRINLDVDVTVADKDRRATSALYVALFENGLASAVTAGENRGRKLQHDQVVRALIGPLGLSRSSPDSHRSVTLQIPPGVQRSRAGLAVFVQSRESGEVLQALAVPLGTVGPD